MAKFYPRMKSRVDKLLPKYGAIYAVTRKGKVSVVSGKEVKGADLFFDATGVRTDYEPKEIDGTVIKSGDIRIVFTSGAELLIGDMVDIDGKQYRVVAPNPIKPADLVLGYKAQLRA